MILSQFINFSQYNFLLHPNVQVYSFECHSFTKIKYGHPWPNKVIKRSQNTVHKVTYDSVSRASESLVAAWEKSRRGQIFPVNDGTTKVIKSMPDRVHI